MAESDAIRVLPIIPSDRSAVRAFWRSAVWRYQHFDVVGDGVQENEGFLARRTDGEVLGILGGWIDRPPVAGVLFAAVASRWHVIPVVAGLLDAWVQECRRDAVTICTFIGHAPWLLGGLRQAGFTRSTSVVTYERVGFASLPAGPTQACVRLAGPADIDALVKLDSTAFGTLWRYPKARLREMLASRSIFLVADVDGSVVGYAIGDGWQRRGLLIRLAVAAAWQRQGIAKRLLGEMQQWFSAQGAAGTVLNTQADNLPARRLYEGLGFRRIGEDIPVFVRELMAGDGEPAARGADE